LTWLGLFYDAIIIALERKKPDDPIEEESFSSWDEHDLKL
jgi:hypothetical protein